MMALLPLLGGAVLSLAIAQDSAGRPASEAAETGDASEVSRAIDARVREAAAEVIREGVVLFNERRDALGCYRIYQGALIGFGPMLKHRPQLREAIASGLTRAAEAAATDVSQAAFDLRGLLDRVFEETGQVTIPDRSLWDRLGGEEAVRAVVHDFVALAAVDPDVDFFRDGRFALDAIGIARLERLLVEFISSASGGPLAYSGRGMEDVHQGMAISGAEFDALAADLAAVLRKYEVPRAEADELIALVASTRKEIVEVPPLWDRLGGEEAVRAVVDDFVARTSRNPEVNFTRDGRYPLDEDGVRRLKDLLVQFISEASGGPLVYEGRPMGPVHRGMGITRAEFDAMAADLAASLREYEVPQAEIDELLAAVESTRGQIVEGR
ncbi:group I truncated hemoglobin [Tautonia sociabilis]|nr:group 1 truncated hemoglobin [Tautonia sociabilis]